MSNTKDLTKLTLTEAKSGLLNKDFTSVEITEAFIKRIEEQRDLNAYITETPEQAIAQAKESDKMIASGKARPMEGLPIGIKDLFCTKGVRTTSGSKMLKDFVPPYESTVTQNLLDAGSIFLGKLNMDEFAMGSANTNSYFGPCTNPWRSNTHPDKKLVPGGSSGGSAASVAARIALAATASDTGGSIRQPAAFCGVVGIKPTYGLCSRWGMIAFASSLDQAGPITQTVSDAALMLQTMSSYDEKDATCLDVERPDYFGNLNHDVRGLKIGIADEYIDGLNPEGLALLEQGISWLQDAGAIIVRGLSLKTTKYALPAYYVVAPAEASSNLARFDGVRYGTRIEGQTLDEMYMNTRGECFGEEVKRRIMIGTYVLSSGHYDCYYSKAQMAEKLIRNDFDQAFKQVDLLLTPTTPSSAFGIEDKIDPITMYLNDIYTVTVNMADLPAISIPSGVCKDGLPLGLQLIGPRFSEQKLLNTGLAMEKAADFRRHFNF